MGWRKMKLGEVLINREGRYKPNDPTIANLKRIDKINFSGQIFISDKDSNTDMILVKKGDLVISGINVEKGAITVYEGEEDITATIHYSSYIFNKDKIDIEFLKVFLRSPDFIQLIKEQVPGGIKTEIKPKHILPLEVFFPDTIKEQKEIAKHFFEKEDKFNELEKHLTYQLIQLENLNQAILQEVVQGKLITQDPKDEPASELLKRIKAEKVKSGKKEKPLSPIKPKEIPFDIPENWVWCRLGEVCEINPRNKVDDELEAGFIPMPMVSQLIGVKPTHEVRKWGAIKTGFTHFANNDVVVAKITPCFENSKAGIIANLPNGIGAGTTELNVLRGNEFVLAEYLYAFVKRIDFLKNGARIMKGVAGQQRVPTEYFYNILIPLPPLSEQKRIVAEVEKQLAKTKQLKEHIIGNQQATGQLLKALLHQTFEVENKNVDQKPIRQTKGKVIELKPTNVDYYRRTVLAAEIVWQLHKEPTLGHLKLQKLIYLCQKTADMQLPTNFLRQAMGPYDNRLMRSIDKQLKEKKWFEFKQGEFLKYKPLEKAGQHHNDFLKYFSAESDSIQFIIDKFKTIKSDIVEIVATLYACMDNMLKENVIFLEALLIQRFYDWSKEKKKFSEDQIKRVLSRMKETGIVPKGIQNSF